jgi:hypothetical protein
MKGYRFYAEMPESRGSKSASMKHNAFTRDTLKELAALGYYCNVVAIPLSERGQPLWHVGEPVMDSFAGLTDRANAPVCSSSTSRDYLRLRCVWIDEALARKLHPNMFHYLENP